MTMYSQDDQNSTVDDTASADTRTPIFFIHIPKTAGTSFRNALAADMGSERIVKNYGTGSAETTAWVKDTAIQRNDYFALIQGMRMRNGLVYSGHLQAQPTCYSFSAGQTVTFVRDPIRQVISHFNHLSRWENLKGSLEEYIVSSRARNFQSRVLWHVPVNMFGMVGITEEFDASVEIFNHCYRLNIACLKENVNEQKSVDDTLDENIEALIRKHNPDDMRLYQHSRRLFEQRYQLYKAGMPWCFGGIQARTPERLTGYAYWQHTSDPVEVVLKKEEKQLAASLATLHRPGLTKYMPPRNGFIGFQFDVTKFSEKELAGAQVVVAQTGQLLMPSVMFEPGKPKLKPV